MFGLRSATGRTDTTWRFTLAILGALAALALALAPQARAVHDTGAFELDGNATSATDDDWDRVCHEVTVTNDPAPPNAIPNECVTATDTASTSTAVSWTAEPNGSASIFTGGGSKDPIDISSWAWKDAGGLPDKDNLLHSFAARYSLPADNDATDGEACPSTGTTCDVLYFGSDRFDNSGDAQQGFWFFQDEVSLTNVKSGGGFMFSGVHTEGDLLVISNFSNGGTVSTISVYTWDPSVSGNLFLEASSSAAKCTGTLAADPFCGIVNEATTLTDAPWSFLDKSGNADFAQGEFYEGGVNLSALGLADECFSSVASETRSSTSTTATLKDFVLGEFGNCSATLTTAASSTGTVLPGASVTDTATVVGSNPLQNPSGTVTFYLCSGVAAGGDCATGGTNIGTGTLSGVIASPGTSTATSAAVNTASNPLAPGRYCFRATWPGDSNYTQDGGFSHTNSTTECFTVQDTSSITTAQKWLPQDTATVTTAGGSTVSGTVTFRLYLNGTCSGDPATTFTDSSAPFETNNTTYRTATTTLSWSASFAPDNGVAASTTTRCERSDLTINNSASDFPPPASP